MQTDGKRVTDASQPPARFAIIYQHLGKVLKDNPNLVIQTPEEQAAVEYLEELTQFSAVLADPEGNSYTARSIR